MCLATPALITKIDGQKAVVKSGDHTHDVDLSLVEGVQVGDYVLAHGDLVIQKLPKEEAEKILSMVSTLNKKGCDHNEEEHGG